MIRCFKSAAWLASLLLILSAGCRKSELNRQVDTTRDHILAERVFINLALVGAEAALAISNPELDFEDTYYLSDCGVILVDEPEEDIHGLTNYTIDFGPDGCRGSDGKTRKGQLIVLQEGNLSNRGARITLSCNAFEIDDYQINGSLVFSNQGMNEDGNPLMNLNVSSAEIIDSESNIISWEAVYVLEQLDGVETNLIQDGVAGFWDDEYAVTGIASGIDREDRGYASEITSSLFFSTSCPYFQSGTEAVRPEGLLERDLDFGSRSCNNNVVVSLNGEDHNIAIR